MKKTMRWFAVALVCAVCLCFPAKASAANVRAYVPDDYLRAAMCTELAKVDNAKWTASKTKITKAEFATISGEAWGDEAKVTAALSLLSGNIVIDQAKTKSAEGLRYMTNVTGIDLTACVSMTTFGNLAPYTDSAKGVLEGLTKLQTVKLPKNIVTIGNKAFEKCESLTSVTFPSQIRAIGDRAFYGCIALKSADLSVCENLPTINARTFYGCTSLTSVKLPTKLATIQYEAFSKCKTLAAITIPSTVTAIGSAAFQDTAALKTISLSRAVVLGGNAFSGSGLINASKPGTMTLVGTGTMSSTLSALIQSNSGALNVG